MRSNNYVFHFFMGNLNERQIDTCAQSIKIDDYVENEIEIAFKLTSSYWCQATDSRAILKILSM